MHFLRLIFISIISSCFLQTSAFIFDDGGSENETLMNHKYDDKCSRNKTVMRRVGEFKTKYDKIKRLSRNEVRLIRRRGFRTKIVDICEAKRDKVRSVTDWFQPVADFCVTDEKTRKDVVLNTLLLFETTLDFVCGMNQSHYEDIYEWRTERCFSDNEKHLNLCKRKSLDLYFWEKAPEKLPSTIQLINGRACNLNYDKMLTCATDVVKSSRSFSCSTGAIELLAYQIDVIKRNSLCFKMKSVSEIIDNSSENLSNIVT